MFLNDLHDKITEIVFICVLNYKAEEDLRVLLRFFKWKSIINNLQPFWPIVPPSSQGPCLGSRSILDLVCPFGSESWSAQRIPFRCVYQRQNPLNHWRTNRRYPQHSPKLGLLLVNQVNSEWQHILIFLIRQLRLYVAWLHKESLKN